VRRVANERRYEVVAEEWRAATEQRDEPARDDDEEHRQRPEGDPDEVRQREQQPEEDCEPRTFETFLVGEPDWVVVRWVDLD
jgi:hypothetical protein